MIINLESVHLTKISVEAPDNDAQERELEIALNSSMALSDDGLTCSVKLGCTVNEKNSEGSPLTVSTEVVGLFSFDEKKSEPDESLQHQLVNELYPYVRASVGMVTSLVDIPKITLPPFRL